MLLAGCGGSKQTTEDAKPFADGFVHRLAVVGTWESIEAAVAPGVTPQVRNLDGPGTLRHDCPPAPAVDAGKDCFVYRLSGSQVVPLGGVQPLNARLRVWVGRAGDHWEVVNYDYGVTR